MRRLLLLLLVSCSSGGPAAITADTPGLHAALTYTAIDDADGSTLCDVSVDLYGSPVVGCPDCTWSFDLQPLGATGSPGCLSNAWMTLYSADLPLRLTQYPTYESSYWVYGDPADYYDYGHTEYVSLTDAIVVGWPGSEPDFGNWLIDPTDDSNASFVDDTLTINVDRDGAAEFTTSEYGAYNCPSDLRWTTPNDVSGMSGASALVAQDYDVEDIWALPVGEGEDWTWVVEVPSDANPYFEGSVADGYGCTAIWSFESSELTADCPSGAGYTCFGATMHGAVGEGMYVHVSFGGPAATIEYTFFAKGPMGGYTAELVADDETGAQRATFVAHETMRLDGTVVRE